MTSLAATAAPPTNPKRERVTDPARDSLLARVVDEYLAACRAGQRPDMAELMAEHPEIADDLAACLASLDFLENIAEQERLLVPHAPGENVNENGNGAGLRRVEGTLGDYRILGEIGRGGMGVVYEAHQISLNRRVALKILPFAAILDDRAKKRFQNEALAAAQLDHPHIVDVYGVGCERGVHYYAMRLIEGRSLADIVQHLREQLKSNPRYTPSSLANLVSTARTAAATQPTTGDTPSSPAPSPQSPAPALRPKLGRDYYRSIATLGMHVAEALDHAHEQGVLHRDIKPANLMLDAAGKVWITDFGLARIDSAASLTHTGDLLGTLRYMSPEQALAKRIPIDHRSDIYSLGVTLYELLTLQPAFDSENRGELLRQVAFEEPSRPRKLDPQIPLDLETIILKAIEKNPADRYATSHMLVDDLREFLANKPIKARPIGMRERCLRLARRHSLSIAAAFALTLLIAAALGIAFALTYKARNDAVAKGEELQRRHDQTVVILHRVNGTVDSILIRLGNLAPDDPMRLGIMEDELEFYKGLQEIDKDNQAAEGQLALALHRMGHLQIQLEQLDESEDNLRKAISIFERQAREEPSSPDYANLLCLAWMDVGRVQFKRNDRTGAIESFQKAISHGEKAVAMSPDNCEFRVALAFPYGQMGMTYASLGRADDSKAAHEREIKLHGQNVASQPKNYGYRIAQGAAIWFYLQSFRHLGEQESAARTLESAIEIHESLHRTQPDEWLVRARLAKLYLFRAGDRYGMERPVVDRSEFESAVALVTKDPSTLYFAAWRLARHPDTNRDHLERAAEWATLAIRQHPGVSDYHNALGLVQYRQGKFREALASLDKSRQLGDANFGYDAIFQAMCFERLGQHDRAVALYLEATSWARQHAPKNPELSAFCREAAGVLGIAESPSP